jgi:hypothetical protein
VRETRRGQAMFLYSSGLSDGAAVGGELASWKSELCRTMQPEGVGASPIVHHHGQ